MNSLTLLPFATALCLSWLPGAAYGQDAKQPPAQLRLDSAEDFEMVNGKAEVVAYRGRRAVHLQPLPGHEADDGSMLAILKDTAFQDGTIEAEVAGAPRAGAAPSMKGFIGIAFRVQPHGSPAELFYLRPSNARSPDQLVRNHSVQYVSAPDFPWQRLRQETPGVYESYVDLEPGVWTTMRIVVSGTKASLYVNGASQPCLIVNDLKRGESRGQIALWAHDTTEAYFASVAIQKYACCAVLCCWPILRAESLR
ncbi:MAG: family 16 glycoside hydrolase [Bryobacteraceae bacterium]|jgi:hypothetical protein